MPGRNIKHYPRAVQFRHYVFQLVDANQGYEWGKESPYGADCSGTVCYPLIAMGFKIRTTADELLKKIFTKPVETHVDRIDMNQVLAIFYVPNSSWTKMNGQIMPKGSAKHVTPVVGWYTVCDADYRRDQILLKTARRVRIDFDSNNQRYGGGRAIWRRIDWSLVEEASRKESMFYDPDPEILELIKKGGF